MDSATLHIVNETAPSWDTASAWSMGCGAARTSTLQVLVLTFILVISSTVAGPIIARLTCSHKLVGYMLLGFVCTERMLDMIVSAHALDDLKWVMVLCKAFTAFETGTQLASAGELKYYVKSVTFAAVSHVAACFGAGLLVLLTLLSIQGFATVPDCDSEPIDVPLPAGGFAMATAAAIGVIATAAEPSMYVDIATEARAQGIHVAAGLRVSSGTAILSTLLLLLAAPTIGFGQHGVVWALVSTIVSMLLSLLMTVLLWKAIVTATRVPLKHWLGLLSPKLGRHYSDTTDRAVKMVLVLGVAAILFWLGEQLERLPASDRPVIVRPLNGTGVLTLMYAPSPALWGPPFALTFQPWACCFFASFLLCNTEDAPQPSAASRRSLADYGPREAARRELERQQRVKSDWRLMLQPFKPYALPALGTLSGLTLTLTLDINPSLILTLPYPNLTLALTIILTLTLTRHALRAVAQLLSDLRWPR